jgi:hypothetical protein
MKLSRVFCLVIVLLISRKSFSQENGLLDSLPTTKEGFIKSEPALLNTINWLENTPLDQEPDKRKLLYATFIGWVTNSPTVTIEVNSKISPMSKKNRDFLIIFKGGWVKYSLQNNYSNDALQCNLAGIKSVIKVYQAGNGVKKDKDIEKLVDMDSKNELESWISSQLGSK